MNRLVQDLKVETESKKKIQTEENLEMKNLGAQTGMSEARLNNRGMEEGISGTEDIIQEMDTSVKEKC